MLPPGMKYGERPAFDFSQKNVVKKVEILPI